MIDQDAFVWPHRMHYLTLAVHTLVSSLCSCNDGVNCNQWGTLDSRRAGGLDGREVSCFPICGCDKTPWQKAVSGEKDSLAQNSDVQNSNTAQMLRQEPEATAHIHSDEQRENGNMCANCSVHKLSLHTHKASDVCCPQSSWVFPSITKARIQPLDIPRCQLAQSFTETLLTWFQIVSS